MRDIAKRIGLESIEEISALVALYRPGPMQFIPNYIKRKHGEEPIEYPHPALEPILKETFGVIIYQEQVMQIAQVLAALKNPAIDLVALEQDRIRGAVRTDFILSAEIIVITLGTVAAATLATRVTVLAGIAVIMTVGVYGLVAGIVKLDDAGLWLSQRPAAVARALGDAILQAAPWLMKAPIRPKER